MDDNEKKYCPECQVGVYRSEGATYFTWIEDELITVQNFPCWVCDVCGKRDWDPQALMQLNMLLSPNAGSPTKINRTLNNLEADTKNKPMRGRHAY